MAIALFSGTEECAYKTKPGIYAKVLILIVRLYFYKYINLSLLGRSNNLNNLNYFSSYYIILIE